jgi:hypothetical protein
LTNRVAGLIFFHHYREFTSERESIGRIATRCAWKHPGLA